MFSFHLQIRFLIVFLWSYTTYTKIDALNSHNINELQLWLFPGRGGDGEKSVGALHRVEKKSI